MGKYPVYLILSGMLLVLASCVPVAGSLYRSVAPATPLHFDLQTDGATRTDLRVEDAQHVMLVLVFELSPGMRHAPEVRYRATVTNGGRVQQRIAGSVGPPEDRAPEHWDEAAPQRVERKLPVLALEKNQASIGVAVEVDTDGNVHVLRRGWGEIHLDPPRFALSFVNAVVVWTLGTLLVLVGAIQWGRQVASVHANPAQGEEGIDERVWCTLCHLSALLGYILPFGHVVGPLLVWGAKRNVVGGVDEAGRESLNFQLTVSLFGLIGIMLSAVFIGLVLLFVLAVFHVSMTLLASLRAQRGELVRYPLNIRMVGPSAR